MKKYSAEDARAIMCNGAIKEVDIDGYRHSIWHSREWFEFRDDGVYHSGTALAFGRMDQLRWKYILELDGDDVPNPLTAPCLPFPFTAHEFAAFMLDGYGVEIQMAYGGDWKNGPDEEMLDSIGTLGRDAKRALREAYAAIGAAQNHVGGYPLELQKEVDRLGDECTQAPLDKGIRERHRIAGKRYREAFATWRKEMVNWLLRPAIPETMPAPDNKPAPDMPATPQKLIEAFGNFTGMSAEWFTSQRLRDIPKLKACRVRPGTGGRNSEPPLFDPYKVLLWICDPSRKIGREVSDTKAWDLFRRHFPKAYMPHADGDPNDD